MTTYKICGYYANTTKRFKTIYTTSLEHAMSINLWKGSVYALYQSGGNWKRIKAV